MKSCLSKACLITESMEPNVLDIMTIYCKTWKIHNMKISRFEGAVIIGRWKTRPEKRFWTTFLAKCPWRGFTTTVESEFLLKSIIALSCFLVVCMGLFSSIGQSSNPSGPWTDIWIGMISLLHITMWSIKMESVRNWFQFQITYCYLENSMTMIYYTHQTGPWSIPRSMGGAHFIWLHCTPTRPPLCLHQASFGAPKVPAWLCVLRKCSSSSKEVQFKHCASYVLPTDLGIHCTIHSIPYTHFWWVFNEGAIMHSVYSFNAISLQTYSHDKVMVMSEDFARN